MVAYFEEEAVRSYTNYLEMIKNNQLPNPPAPQLAIDYYGLQKGAKLSDMIKCVRADEEHHSKVNHRMAEL